MQNSAQICTIFYLTKLSAPPALALPTARSATAQKHAGLLRAGGGGQSPAKGSGQGAG